MATPCETFQRELVQLKHQFRPGQNPMLTRFTWDRLVMAAAMEALDLALLHEERLILDAFRPFPGKALPPPPRSDAAEVIRAMRVEVGRDLPDFPAEQGPIAQVERKYGL